MTLGSAPMSKIRFVVAKVLVIKMTSAKRLADPLMLTSPTPALTESPN